jgi:hypothetical protein
MNRIIACTLLCVLMSVYAEPGFANDGNRLLQQCQQAIRLFDNPKNLDPAEAFDANYCIGYVEGILDTHDVYRNWDSLSQVCYPESGITLGQGIRIIVKYLNDNPDKLHLSQQWLAIGALSIAFPCKPTD